MHPQLMLNLFEYSAAAAWAVLVAVIVLLAMPLGLRWLRWRRAASDPGHLVAPLQPATRST